MNEPQEPAPPVIQFFDRLLELLNRVLPAFLIYLLGRSKKELDAKTAELTLKDIELQTEIEKNELHNENDKKSVVDIIDDFLR